MKLLSKSVLGGVVLSSVIGLTACQNMSMNPNHTAHNGKTMQDQQNVERLTDGQILKVLSTANMGEIMQANAALPKLQNSQVRSFAQGMIKQHGANEQKGQALGNRLQLVPQVSHTSNALQADSNQIVTKISQANSAVDKDYMMSQIMVHSKVLQTIDTQLLPNAKNPELRNMLVETRSAVAMHLKMAEQIKSSMP